MVSFNYFVLNNWGRLMEFGDPYPSPPDGRGIPASLAMAPDNQTLQEDIDLFTGAFC